MPPPGGLSPGLSGSLSPAQLPAWSSHPWHISVLGAQPCPPPLSIPLCLHFPDCSHPRWHTPGQTWIRTSPHLSLGFLMRSMAQVHQIQLRSFWKYKPCTAQELGRREGLGRSLEQRFSKYQILSSMGAVGEYGPHFMQTTVFQVLYTILMYPKITEFSSP